MLADVLGALQDAALVGALRRSHWVYPLVNAGHIVGLALLFGAIVPLDLRLIGLLAEGPGRRHGAHAAAGRDHRAGAGGLTGALLFSVSAVKYAGLTLFQIKLAADPRRAPPTRCCCTGRRPGAPTTHGELPAPRRASRSRARCRSASGSSTIVAGRMLGYLD